MNVNIRSFKEVKIIELQGELDGNTAPQAQAQILPVAKQDSRILLDMTQVSYMSSAGLRLLLLTYRTITGRGGRVVLVGLSDDLKETMSLTGFLDFFGHCDDLDAGIAAIL